MELFDAHLHIIDPRYPLVANQGFVPGPFTCDDYLARLQGQQLIGGAVVSGSYQAFDQTGLLHALEVPGPAFVGVTQLPESVSDRELAARVFRHNALAFYRPGETSDLTGAEMRQ